MSCYHPFGLINVTDCNKYDVSVLKSRHFRINNDKNGAIRFVKLPDDWEKHQDTFINLAGSVSNKAKFMTIPCGSCIGCRLDYSKAWATRCFGESQYYTDNWFVTLTYDDDHLPVGEVGNPTLIKEDLSKFIKALRNYGFVNLRFFGCGEYGEDTHRPHYHVILFNCPLSDLTEQLPYYKDGCLFFISKTDENGDPLYYSEVVSNAWHNKGNILIGRVTYKSCAYVARYVCKKIKGVNSHIYEDLGIIPEFVNMSRRPGIGKKFILDHYDELKDNPFLFMPGESPFLSGFGNYFTKIQKAFNLDDYNARNASVESFFQDSLKTKTFINSKCINAQNADSELIHIQKTKILKRNIDSDY